MRSVLSKSLLVCFPAFLMLFVLSSCDLAENYTKMDRSGDLSFSEYRKEMLGKPAAIDPYARDENANVPEMMSLDAADLRRSNISGKIPLVSVSVNQMVSLREILFDLADRADFDLILDPGIVGSVIYTAKNKPFDQVIDEISDLAGLKYEFKGRLLRLEVDRPYMKRYRLTYLNLVRGFTSSVNASVSVSSGEGGAGNGSSFALNSSSQLDFWNDLTANIAQIMSLSEEFNTVLRTAQDPSVEVIEVSAASSEEDESSEDGESSSEDEEGEEGEEGEESSSEESTSDSSESSDGGSEDGGADASGGSEEEDAVSFIVNRMAGLITVFGTDRQHKLIDEYLEEIKRSVATQVLIEAKILEVQLTDEFSSGINWTTVFRESMGITNLSFSATAPQFIPAQTGNLTFTFDGADLDTTIQAISRFGTVRALASPRVTVLNNQSAVLSVAKNRVFFELEIEQTTEDGVTETDISSEVNTIPEGVVVNVFPAVNPDTKEIMMSLRPSVTRIDDVVNDPAVAFLNVPGVESEIPIVDVREIDTVVNMLSGEVVVIGGLIQDRSVAQQEGIPVAKEMPILGGLFRNQGDKTDKYELVVMLRATVLDGRSTIHPTDKRLYKTMAADRRPFNIR